MLFLGPAFFHYCISTLMEDSQVVRRERGLPNEREPKTRLCNKHSALLHKYTCCKSLKTSAIVTHDFVGSGLAANKTIHTCNVCFRGALSFTDPHALSNLYKLSLVEHKLRYFAKCSGCFSVH